jgi:dihydroxyacid dehydratase/phosphogluconate dehydratase
MNARKTLAELRSRRWFSVDDLRAFGHRSRARQMGYDQADCDRPIIGIINTWSDINPCHAHFPDRVQWVKRGILQAGGMPIELPALSLSEPFVKPTTMLYRNLLAMECEELIRSHPIDGVVLMGGCDKTTPALIMGAISVGLPAIFVPAGPMLRGHWHGKTLGSGSDSWKYWDERRAGTITAEDWAGIEGGIARSYGHCMTMGTASTMTAYAEALGLTLPGASAIPAADSSHQRMAAASGRRAVEMVWEDLTPARILTREAFDNATMVQMAIGGSTNAIIHAIAMAKRAGLAYGLDEFDAISRRIPVIANIRPSGSTYLMEDFFYAGGLRAVLKRIAPHLNGGAITVTAGRSSRALKKPAYIMRTSSARSTGRSMPKAPPRCCAAIWRPMAA